MKQKPLKISTYTSWAKYPDFVYKRKKVSTYTIELYGGKDRGAVIVVWEPAKRESLGLAQDISSDGKHYVVGQANFMYYSSAIDEYSMLKNVNDVLNLLWRAM